VSTVAAESLAAGGGSGGAGGGGSLPPQATAKAKGAARTRYESLRMRISRLS
jgi:hypothetical protein